MNNKDIIELCGLLHVGDEVEVTLEIAGIVSVCQTRVIVFR
jgi:hypothetical protein